MDDIKIDEEYDALPTENFNMGNGDDDDNADGKLDIVQHDETGNICVDPMVLFS